MLLIDQFFSQTDFERGSRRVASECPIFTPTEILKMLEDELARLHPRCRTTQQYQLATA